MLKKLAILIVVLVFTFIFGSYFKNKQTNSSQEKIHYHAGFVVFKDGKKVDFSDSIYMNIKPCIDDEDKGDQHELTENEIQMEKAHLHDNIGEIVHVHIDDSRWRDLFTNINYPIDYASASGYLNGTLTPDFQNKNINTYDSLVVFIGKVDEKLLSNSITKDRVVEVENNGGGCSD